MNAKYTKSLHSLMRHLEDYKKQLSTALDAANKLTTTSPETEEFSDALAALHVSATILDPYSQGVVDEIDRLTESIQD